MDIYTDFAAVYDTFMDETPYDVWGDFIAELIDKYGVSKPVSDQEVPGCRSNDMQDVCNSDCTFDGEANENPDIEYEDAIAEEKNLIVELGCGTGSFTQVMKRKGYDIMGTDISPEMLNIARHKAADSELDIMYLEQDMRELDLYCTAGTIISVCDSVNYLLEDDDVIETFKLVNNFLFPGGIFIFDFNTLHKYRDIIGDTTIAENREDCSFIWDNYYHEEEHINEYDLTIYARCSKDDEIFRRSVETHYQRGYTLEEMCDFVKAAGLELVTTIDADTHEQPTSESERIYIVAREKGKV
ncbi:class I SAM-dependent DNA methyltransferase [Butyrivibrio sp. YAB3001]|uniref:class I SAM-dependent DNA methyltransferase n=1 Tax=Butyrivibrio sp. YAB3001 TaxID=1520812 RepID=UPI0008F66EFF|nr:class I SAM-dependent methyltransferase [Butyrivibrio sp. YAB3001]SFB84552.1 Methyltransferase domain-containing protein [Butyrivibrio sp. YAB3001]